MSNVQVEWLLNVMTCVAVVLDPVYHMVGDGILTSIFSMNSVSVTQLLTQLKMNGRDWCILFFLFFIFFKYQYQ